MAHRCAKPHTAISRYFWEVIGAYYQLGLRDLDTSMPECLSVRISTPVRFAWRLLALILVGCGAAIAANVDDLYQAQAIVTGQREETRGAGLAQCLTDVLVKLSGDPRLIDESVPPSQIGNCSAVNIGWNR